MESLSLLTSGFVFSFKFKLIQKNSKEDQTPVHNQEFGGRFYIYKFA